MRATIVAGLAALALLVVARAGRTRRNARAGVSGRKWQAGWVRLADKVQAPVYCPTWMPNPLDAKIGGDWQDIYSIGKDRSYLVSFLEHGDLGSGDVHVNFRGYPGRTTIPRCPAPVGHGTVGCFSNPVGHMSANGIRATVYQTNRGRISGTSCSRGTAAGRCTRSVSTSSIRTTAQHGCGRTFCTC